MLAAGSSFKSYRQYLFISFVPLRTDLTILLAVGKDNLSLTANSSRSILSSALVSCESVCWQNDPNI